MRRELVWAVAFGVMTAGAAHGQHAVGVSAEIVDAVRVEPLDVRLEREGERLNVGPVPKRRDSRLLEQVRVTEEERPADVKPSGRDRSPTEEPVRSTSRVMVTRVVAVNS